MGGKISMDLNGVSVSQSWAKQKKMHSFQTLKLKLQEFLAHLRKEAGQGRGGEGEDN